MFRLTTVKLSLISAFATLFLLIAMLASTDTASAHTAGSQIHAVQPQISVFPDGPINPTCKSFFVLGTGFVPGPVHWADLGYPAPLKFTPNGVPANASGKLAQDLIICGPRFGLPQAHTVIYAIGADGTVSNKVFV